MAFPYNQEGEVTDQVERYWEKVEMHGPDECWPWLATINGRGYGQLTIEGKHFLAHRLAWELTNGPIPDRLYVCHTCDNPGCVNPLHLFAGSQTENQRDMAQKGRSNRGANRWSAKLTREEVWRMRELYATGTHSQRVLAKRFGVSQPQVSHIVRREQWAWLES